MSFTPPERAPDRPPPRKRNRPGLKTKVLALEEQMSHVRSSLDSVVNLLQRLPQSAPLTTSGPSTVPTAPHSGPSTVPYSGSLLTGPSSSSISTVVPLPLSQPAHQPAHPPPLLHSTSTSSSSARPLSLEQWVQQVASDPPPQPTSVDSDDEGTMVMKKILRKEEEERLRADGNIRHPSPPSDHDHHISNDYGHNWQPGGERRYSLEMLEQRGSLQTAVLDAVDLGLVNETDGKALFDLFFANAHPYMPVYDPIVDTWPSLRRRSPFSITTILYVGRKIVDGGGPESDTQRLLREHAENIGKTTLFSPVSSLEALQAMIVLASWGETVWRPGSHALSMALDMELYKCLPRLAQAPEATQLMQGSRLWLLVAKMAIEMAYNHGRPLQIDESVLNHACALLDHPAALPTDGRIVASCEALILRFPLHKVLITGHDDNLDHALQRVNEGLRAWDLKWTQHYARIGLAHDDIIVTDHRVQRDFALIIANSSILKSVRTPEDAHRLSPQRRHYLLASLDAARTVIASMPHTERIKIVAANHYSHVALVSVARIFIRLISLFPEGVDVRAAARDLTVLVTVLAEFPGVRFAHQLRDVIKKARKKRVLPETRAASPELGFVPESLHSQSPLEFDVFTAEQLLNVGGWGDLWQSSNPAWEWP